jgi:hypothetical protein
MTQNTDETKPSTEKKKPEWKPNRHVLMKVQKRSKKFIRRDNPEQEQ